MLKEKAIVVTGGAGFIGSGMIRYLNQIGHTNLIIVDHVDHPVKKEYLKNKIYQEVVSIEKMFNWLQGRQSEIEAFIHLGACSDTLEKNEQFLRENNTLFTQRLAEYALKHNIRFVYASSAATYGDGSQGFSDTHEKLDFLKPLNLYGVSKHAFDVWALKEGILNELVGLKYFNVFGPNESHKGRMASMIFKMVPVIQQEGVIRLYKSTEPERFKDGGQCRDFIYVKDAVHMTYQLLLRGEGGIFNIGMGKPTTWNEVAVAVFKALHKPVSIQYIDMPQEMVAQYQNYTCADMSKFHKVCGVVSNYSLEEAVIDYVQQHLIPNQVW